MTVYVPLRPFPKVIRFFRSGAKMTSLLKLKSSDVTLNVACELPKPKCKTEFSRTAKIEKRIGKNIS